MEKSRKFAYRAFLTATDGTIIEVTEHEFSIRPPKLFDERGNRFVLAWSVKATKSAWLHAVKILRPKPGDCVRVEMVVSGGIEKLQS